MGKKASSRDRYFDLAENNTFQSIIFALVFILALILIFHLLLPFIQHVVISSLNGKVYNNGIILPTLRELPDQLKGTSYYTNWAIDIYIKTPQEARYWLNPVMSLALPSALMALTLAVALTSLFSPKLGYIRRKIEREIANAVDKISYKTHGFYSDSEQKELEKKIIMSDLRDLHEYKDEWDIPLDDLKILHKAILWKGKSILYKIGHINDGIAMYMRFHFTVQYTNTVLGLVYIGAALLILIIGLRGLKFIPSTEPSMVFFALGLEFSMLITYALTLMYSKEEDGGEKTSEKHEQQALNPDLGTSKDVEKLLKVFIKSQKPGDN